MTFHQKIFAIVVSLGILFIILEMVRRRKVKEEYSWLWLLVGALMVGLAIWQDLLSLLSRLIGAVNQTTTIFLLGFIFLLLINIDYSIRISTYSDQIKKLAQRVAILIKELEDLKNERK